MVAASMGSGVSIWLQCTVTTGTLVVDTGVCCGCVQVESICHAGMYVYMHKSSGVRLGALV
jgi:hypothetical protein